MPGLDDFIIDDSVLNSHGSSDENSDNNAAFASVHSSHKSLSDEREKNPPTQKRKRGRPPKKKQGIDQRKKSPDKASSTKKQRGRPKSVDGKRSSSQSKDGRKNQTSPPLQGGDEPSRIIASSSFPKRKRGAPKKFLEYESPMLTAIHDRQAQENAKRISLQSQRSTRITSTTQNAPTKVVDPTEPPKKRKRGRPRKRPIVHEPIGEDILRLVRENPSESESPILGDKDSDAAKSLEKGTHKGPSIDKHPRQTTETTNLSGTVDFKRKRGRPPKGTTAGSLVVVNSDKELDEAESLEKGTNEGPSTDGHPAQKTEKTTPLETVDSKQKRGRQRKDATIESSIVVQEEPNTAINASLKERQQDVETPTPNETESVTNKPESPQKQKPVDNVNGSVVEDGTTRGKKRGRPPSIQEKGQRKRSRLPKVIKDDGENGTQEKKKKRGRPRKIKVAAPEQQVRVSSPEENSSETKPAEEKATSVDQAPKLPPPPANEDAADNEESSSSSDIRFFGRPQPDQKTLVCAVCHGSRDLELKGQPILLCDGPGCDREYHLACCTPSLQKVPHGNYYCLDCDKRGSTTTLIEYFDAFHERRAAFESNKQFVLSLLRLKQRRKKGSRCPQSDFDRLHAHYGAMRRNPENPGDLSVVLSPSFLIGKPLRLECGDQYHNGRIIDYRNTTCYDKDVYWTKEFGNIEYLVRFPAGVDNRKESYHQWLLLDEHAVEVGVTLIWVRSPSRNKSWRPGMFWLRSSLALFGVQDELSVEKGQIRYVGDNNSSTNEGFWALTTCFGERERVVEDLAQDTVHFFSEDDIPVEELNYWKGGSSRMRNEIGLALVEWEEEFRVQNWRYQKDGDTRGWDWMTARDEMKLLQKNFNPCPVLEQGLDQMYLIGENEEEDDEMKELFCTKNGLRQMEYDIIDPSPTAIALHYKGCGLNTT